MVDLARMPKIELHVHLEGSIRPETLRRLAGRHGVELPEDLREWYRFRDFNHFVEVYLTASSCIRTVDDLALIAREFVDGQIDQNVIHTEVTYTAETVERVCGIPFEEQWVALQDARDYAESRGVSLEYVLDIVREIPAESGLRVANWAIERMGSGVCALGLTGIEANTPVERHADAFRRAHEAGLPITAHAGETSGPQAIWDCLKVLGADRIGHGVRCLEDETLVDELAQRQIPLEVCPSSNVCLGVVPSMALHPIQTMLAQGLNVGLNSDDPPMFGTTLTGEWSLCEETFGWSAEQIEQILLETVRAAFVTDARRGELELSVREFFS